MRTVSTLPTTMKIGATTYTKQQLDLMWNTAAKDCNSTEFSQFMHVAGHLGLDPMRKQIYALVFSKDDPVKRQMSIIIGIDGYRTVARRTGDYRPDDKPPRFTIDPVAIDPATNPQGLIDCEVTVYFYSHNEWHAVPHKVEWQAYAPIIEAGNDDDYEWVDTGETWSDSGKPKKRKQLKAGAVRKAKLDPNKKRWIIDPKGMLAKCFSDDTEILTARGFRKFSEVDSPILSVTEDGLTPVSAKPFSQQYCGPMIVLDSDDLNFSVTPNHDMVTTAGKIEAGDLYELARARAKFWIPRIAPQRKIDAAITDHQLAIAAAYLADGTDQSSRSFVVSVSREKKVNLLSSINVHYRASVMTSEGAVAHTETRSVTTQKDKTAFHYTFADAGGLALPGKAIDLELLLSLSGRQARLFIDHLIFFDGTTQQTGVRRFLTTNPRIKTAFEVGCIAAGYSISKWTTKTSDISTKPCFQVTISDWDAIPVMRWGRDYLGTDHGGTRQHTGLETSPNKSGRVWCVTVPSGVIVVRRNGFSMLCGNCAEAGAIRKAFPDNFAGVYEISELDRAEAIDLSAAEYAEAAAVEKRLEMIGGKDSILFDFCDDRGLHPVPLGKLHGECEAFLRKYADDPIAVDTWRERNEHQLKEFWARAKSDALDIKRKVEAITAKKAAEP